MFFESDCSKSYSQALESIINTDIVYATELIEPQATESSSISGLAGTEISDDAEGLSGLPGTAEIAAVGSFA